MQRSGYKCWKIPGRQKNWLQWNDGGTRLPIEFDTADGHTRTWKLFARFPRQPRALWEKPARYEHDKKWMPGGDDVWGCSYESLRKLLRSGGSLREQLKEDVESSHRYALAQYHVVKPPG